MQAGRMIMSVVGPKRTFPAGKGYPLSGAKRTCRRQVVTSANDPKQTWIVLNSPGLAPPSARQAYITCNSTLADGEARQLVLGMWLQDQRMFDCRNTMATHGATGVEMRRQLTIRAPFRLVRTVRLHFNTQVYVVGHSVGFHGPTLPPAGPPGACKIAFKVGRERSATSAASIRCSRPRMSACGPKPTSPRRGGMSAFAGKADINPRRTDVRY
jgi:hypothetical protein